jgi:8-oxo-dGTP pyrophosphatase MutT (NUDIX family)
MEESKNPWTVLTEKQVYNNPWIGVTEYDVINPGGGKGIYGKVHFKNLAVGIIPLDKDLNTWLVGQYRFTIDQYSWEIPEGGSVQGTDPMASAKRELLEETGLIAKRWTPVLQLHLSNSVSDEYGIIYLAQDLAQHTATPEETEELQIKKIPFETLYQMVNAGQVLDSLTIAAVLKIKLMLLEGRIIV